ncbi:hypothetical protein H6P81_015956 [Aristolochia fimbriata]|uniref:Uncharacterized protein n=1 Tax=Aristolochia fimbriata TaxID=158543 RepID=A0AAV7EA02_ARIFI|nr:hypothetical protein H6P81_015956 [Aristolochia fimbriata]
MPLDVRVARATPMYSTKSIALADRPGIPSKRAKSSARVDYAPALCTHRPSLLPIEWSGEVFGSRAALAVNLRKDHCRFHEQRPKRASCTAMPRRRRARRVRKRPSNPLACVSDRAPTGSASARPRRSGDEHTVTTTFGAICAKRKRKREAVPAGAWPWHPTSNTNPANHRVFERKLHPRPLGQGYTCLGVTPDVFSPNPVPCCPTAGGAAGRRGRADWSSLPPLARLAEKHFAPRAPRHDEWWLRPPWPCVARSRVRGPGSEEDPCRQLPP